MDEIVWVKMTVNRRLAKSHGYYLQHAKEVCLVGKKGKDPQGLKVCMINFACRMFVCLCCCMMQGVRQWCPIFEEQDGNLGTTEKTVQNIENAKSCSRALGICCCI